MESWNADYLLEAQAIAAQIEDERGYHWKAREIRLGRRDKGPEVLIAMRALMVGRGEHTLKRPLF